MTPIEEINTLQKKFKKVEESRLRLQGALEEHKKNMRDLSGSSEPDKAREILESLEEEILEMKDGIQAKLLEFNNKYADIIHS